MNSDILDRAADIIDERGLGHAAGWRPEPGSTHPVCLEGALRVAAQELRPNKLAQITAQIDAKAAVQEFLGDTYPEEVNSFAGHVIAFQWNDRPGRTADEVKAVLRAAGLVEHAKEQAPARELVSA